MATIFPNVEAEVVQAVTQGLVGTPFASAVVAASEFGPTPAALIVWVRRDGGPTVDRFRETARISVNVYAKSTDDSVDDLARTVSALVRASAYDGSPIVRVTQDSGPSLVPDTHPRRLMTFDVTVRGADL